MVKTHIFCGMTILSIRILTSKGKDCLVFYSYDLELTHLEGQTKTIKYQIVNFMLYQVKAWQLSP